MEITYKLRDLVSLIIVDKTVENKYANEILKECTGAIIRQTKWQNKKR